MQHSLKKIDALLKKGDFEKAKDEFFSFLKKNPDNFQLHYSFALLLLRLGETASAIDVLEKGLKLAPDNLKGLNDLAVMYKKNGKFEASEKLFKRALEISPDYYYSLNGLIALYLDNELPQEALELAEKAVRLYGEKVKPHIHLGLAYRQLKEFRKALDAFNAGLQVLPDSDELNFQAGALALEAKDYGQAELFLKRAVALNPYNVGYYNNLGVALFGGKKYEEAVAVLEKGLPLNGDHSITYNNIALALHGLRRLKEAAAAAETAIRLRPDNADAYNNLGAIYEDALEFEKARECFVKAVAINPEHIQANWNLAVVALRMGDLREGFERYEWRWKNADAPAPKPILASKEWQGEDLAGKSILVYSEQGFGDAIQFSRYLPMLEALGAKVIFQCRRELLPLMEKLHCVSQTVTEVGGVASDYNVALLSLPFLFKTDLAAVPNKFPYLSAEGEKVVFERDPAGLNIGFVWSGNPTHKRHGERALDLRELAILFDVPGTRFFSLQVGEDSRCLKELGLTDKVTDLSPELTDFAKTASVISQLDLILGSDTSVMHLCGALGVKGYVFIPRLNDWRWLLEREDSPWYPTLKLFRQKEYKRWDDVVLRVREEIRQEVRAGTNDACRPGE